MTDKEIDAALDAYDAMNPFGFSDENTLPDEQPEDEGEEANDLQEEQESDEEEYEQDAHEEEEVLEEEEEEEQKPKGAQARISQLAKQKNELSEQNKKLQEELAAIRAEIQPLKNLASGLDALGVNKQQQANVSLDDQLKQYGINADDFDSDGEKRLALQTARLEQYTQQQRVEASYQQVEQYVVNAINAQGDESTRNANLGAVNYLIQDKAADLAEEYGISQADAFNEAKREILRQAAVRARTTGKDISAILVEKGKSLMSRRGDLANKPLQSKQKNATVNQQAREQVVKRAGKPNVDTVNITELLENTDPYMSKFFGG